VKRTNILAALLVTLSLISTGCGTSDSVKSITLSATGSSSGGFFNLVGADGTLQLNATANYNSGKVVDVTNSVTYTVTTVGTTDALSGSLPLPAYGPNTVPINATGLMTAEVAMCTWTDVGTPPPVPPIYNWEYTGYYQVVAVYNGMPSQPVAVGVGSLQGDAPNGACGPQ
jgi:hypothetical protein